MPESSTMTVIEPFSSSGDPGCFTGALAGPLDGQTVTVVIARGVGICLHASSTFKGVVFYDGTAVMWSCLSITDLVAYRNWSAKHFPGARVLEVSELKSAVVCPPPLHAEARTADQVKKHADDVAEVQKELTRLGVNWLAQQAA